MSTAADEAMAGTTRNQRDRPAKPIVGAWSGAQATADQPQRDVYSEALSPWLHASPAFPGSGGGGEPRTAESKASPALSMAQPLGLGRPTTRPVAASGTFAAPSWQTDSSVGMDSVDELQRSRASGDRSVASPPLQFSSDISALGAALNAPQDFRMPSIHELRIQKQSQAAQENGTTPSSAPAAAEAAAEAVDERPASSALPAAPSAPVAPAMPAALARIKSLCDPATRGERSASGVSFVMSPDTAKLYNTASPPPPLIHTRVSSKRGSIVYETHEWILDGADSNARSTPTFSPPPLMELSPPESWASAHMDSADPSKFPHAASLWARLPPDAYTFSPSLQPIHIVRGSPPAWANVSPRTGAQSPEKSHASAAAADQAGSQQQQQQPAAAAPRVSATDGAVPYSNEAGLSYVCERDSAAAADAAESQPDHSVLVFPPESVHGSFEYENDATTLIDWSHQPKPSSVDENLLEHELSPLPSSEAVTAWSPSQVGEHGTALGLHVPRSDKDEGAAESGTEAAPGPVSAPRKPSSAPSMVSGEQDTAGRVYPPFMPSHARTHDTPFQSTLPIRRTSRQRTQQLEGDALQELALPRAARVADVSYAATPRHVSYGAAVVDDTYISPMDGPLSGAGHESYPSFAPDAEEADTLQAPRPGVVEMPPTSFDATRAMSPTATAEAPTTAPKATDGGAAPAPPAPAPPAPCMEAALMPALQYTVPFKLSSRRRYKTRSARGGDAPTHSEARAHGSPNPPPPPPLPKSPVRRGSRLARKPVPTAFVADEQDELAHMVASEAGEAPAWPMPDVSGRWTGALAAQAMAPAASAPSSAPAAPVGSVPMSSAPRAPGMSRVPLSAPAVSGYRGLQPALAPELCGPVQSREGRDVWLDTANDDGNTTHLSMLGAVADRSDVFNFETYFEASLQRIRQEMNAGMSHAWRAPPSAAGTEPPTRLDAERRKSEPPGARKSVPAHDLFHNAPPINARTFASLVMALNEFSYVVDDDGSAVPTHRAHAPPPDGEHAAPELPPLDPLLPEEHELMGHTPPGATRDRRWTFHGMDSPMLGEAMPADVRLPLDFVTKPNSVLSRGRPVKKTHPNIFYASNAETRRYRQRARPAGLSVRPPYEDDGGEYSMEGGVGDSDDDEFSQSMAQPPRPAYVPPKGPAAPPPPPRSDAPKATLLGDYAARPEPRTTRAPPMPAPASASASASASAAHAARSSFSSSPPPPPRPSSEARQGRRSAPSFAPSAASATPSSVPPPSQPRVSIHEPESDVHADSLPKKKRGKDEKKFATWFKRRAYPPSKEDPAPTPSRASSPEAAPRSSTASRAPGQASPRTSTSTNNTMKFGRRTIRPGFEPSQPGKYHLAGTVSLPTLNVARTAEQRARDETGVPETEPALIQSLLAAPSSSTVRARAGIIKSIPYIGDAAPPTGQVLVAEERKVLVRPVM